MGRKEKDDDKSTIISVDMSPPDEKGPAKKGLSAAKLEQLAAIRVKAVASRQRTALTRLEQKIADLRERMGALNNEHLEKVVEAMMEQEDRLREKQNKLTLDVSTALQEIKEEMRGIRKRLDGHGETRRVPSGVASLASLSLHPPSKHR